MRTARSRTSGENLFDLFIAPFSQELEPPQIPGRFRAQRMRDTFETHDWPFNGDVVAVSDVIILLGEEYRPAPSHKAILAELLSMADGSFNLLAQRRNSSGMKQKRVIVLRNVNNWKAAGATAIYSHYEETVIKYSRPQF
jgi:hypothetical protein